MNEDYSVYTLSDPRTQEIRYVGMSQDAFSRYGNHLIDRSNKTKADWILDMRKDGLMPTLTIIEANLTRDQALEQEKYWITHYLNLNAKLTNSFGYAQTWRGYKREHIRKQTQRAKIVFSSQNTAQQTKPIPTIKHTSVVLPPAPTHQTDDEVEPSYTIDELAKLFRVSTSLIKTLTKRKELKSVQIKHEQRFTESAINEYIASQRKKAEEEIKCKTTIS